MCITFSSSPSLYTLEFNFSVILGSATCQKTTFRVAFCFRPELTWPSNFFHVNTFQAILHGTLVQPRGHGSKLFSPGFEGQKANAAAKTSSSQMRTSSSQIAGNCTLKLQRTQLLQLIHILCMRTSAFADNFFKLA